MHGMSNHFFLLALLLVSPLARGFLYQPPKSTVLSELVAATTTTPWSPQHPFRQDTPVVCFMAKGKKRPFDEIFDEGLTSAPESDKANKTIKKKKKAPRKVSGGATGSAVSPLLSQWAATKNEDEDGDASEETKIEAADSDDEGDGATTFAAFEPTGSSSKSSSTSKRRVRQSERMMKEEKMQAQILKLVEDLEDILENQKGSSEPILAQTKKLMDVEASPSLRPLTTSKTKLDYRLAWAGSDETLCHVGTGLHKVPLARMQEVFLSLKGRNEIEVLEVISILGPFPNVRNTLQGDCMDMKAGDGSFTEWTVKWESMIDGTGNEILSGGEARKVPLHMYFSDKNALVAVVPNDDNDSDPLGENGKNVLVFVREKDLDGKLAENRVL